MSKRLTRTLSKSKMDASGFAGVNSKRKIKAEIEVFSPLPPLCRPLL